MSLNLSEFKVPSTEPTQFKSSNELGKSNMQKQARTEALEKIEIQPLREINAYKYQTITFKDVDEFKSFYNKNYDYINKITTRGLNILYKIPDYKLGRKHGEIVLMKTHLKQGTQSAVNGFKSHSDNEIDVNDMIDTWSDNKFEDNEQRQRNQDMIKEITGNASGFEPYLGSYDDVDVNELPKPKAPVKGAYAHVAQPEREEQSITDNVNRDAYMNALNRVRNEKKWEEARRAAAEGAM